VAALLAAEARPGDITIDFRSPTLSMKLSLPPPGSISEASLASVELGLQRSRMVRTIPYATPECCHYVLGAATLSPRLLHGAHPSRTAGHWYVMSGTTSQIQPRWRDYRGVHVRSEPDTL
jgi:hypothetical protein